MAQKTALRRASRLIAPLRREQSRAFSTSRCQHAGASEAASRLLDTFAGSVSVRRQLLDANQIQKLALTLGRPVLGGVDVSDAAPRTGTPIPPGHHLVYFTAGGLESELGPDGTDLTFNAAEPFTRRMWAGGKMSWPDKGVTGGATLLVGDEVEEHTRLLSATVKKSRSAGEMVLVEVEKEIRAPRGYSVVDRRSWVFRPEIDPEKVDAYAVSTGEIARGPTVIQDIPADGSQSSFPVRQLCWSPVGLFRFSALTFNGHKIHYNEEWSRRVEGHPGAVVHGPLNLINILDYWRDVHGNGGEPASISYRAMSPLYAGETYNIRTEGTRESGGGRIVDIVAEKNGTVLPKEQIRRLSIHEYQSHKLLSEFGAPVPRGKVVRTATEARAAINELGAGCIIKAQVLGGGRADGQFDNGLRSGVQAVEDADHGETVASKMLGHRLRTRHSGNEGHAVNELYVVESVKFDAKWYLAMTIDRENYGPAIVISKKGGSDIDIIAKEHPESLFTFTFRLSEGITADLVSRISAQLELTFRETENLQRILEPMYKIFSQKDATSLEINPLAHSADGSLACLDANFTFDNSAAQRQPDIFALRDQAQEVPDEVEAESHGLLYVKTDGNIGNVVNGAGLAMATNDAIGFEGGVSSNFLDAGGKATKETMQQAFGIITRDQRVKAILVNIYGGLTRCDMIAESIIGASKELGIRVPMVVRLQGTNSAKGLKLLKEANLGLHVESDFGRAAQRVVELANSA